MRAHLLGASGGGIPSTTPYLVRTRRREGWSPVALSRNLRFEVTKPGDQGDEAGFRGDEAGFQRDKAGMLGRQSSDSGGEILQIPSVRILMRMARPPMRAPV